METDYIERIVDKTEEDNVQRQNEEEKSNNEEEEESEKNKEETSQNLEKIDEQDSKTQKENLNNQNIPNQEVIDPYSTTTYILKYKRTKEELKEFAIETNLPKSENCLFMLNLKIIKNEDFNINNNRENEMGNAENFFVLCCHEIAAIYFDEIYERIYSLEDLFNENIFFKVFDSIEEARSIIDESLKNNEKNPKKLFINLKDKELKLHMKLSFFDKEEEIIFNIPRKVLSDKDKNNLLPEFLKEIQQKMNHLKEENKKLKTQNQILESSKGGSDFLIETEIKKNKEKENDLKIGLEEDQERKNRNNESKSVKKKIIKKKIKKKTGNEQPKKISLPEENFF